MLDILRERVTSVLCLLELHKGDQPPPLPRMRAPQRTVMTRGSDDPLSSRAALPENPIVSPVRAPDFNKNDPATWVNTPRNAPCPCESGKKYKYCHGKVA